MRGYREAIRTRSDDDSIYIHNSVQPPAGSVSFQYIGVANISMFFRLEEFDYVKGGHVGPKFPAKNFDLCNSMVALLCPPCDGIPAPWL